MKIYNTWVKVCKYTTWSSLGSISNEQIFWQMDCSFLREVASSKERIVSVSLKLHTRHQSHMTLDSCDATFDQWRWFSRCFKKLAILRHALVLQHRFENSPQKDFHQRQTFLSPPLPLTRGRISLQEKNKEGSTEVAEADIQYKLQRKKGRRSNFHRERQITESL